MGRQDGGGRAGSARGGPEHGGGWGGKSISGVNTNKSPVAKPHVRCVLSAEIYCFCKRLVPRVRGRRRLRPFLPLDGRQERLPTSLPPSLLRLGQHFEGKIAGGGNSSRRLTEERWGAQGTGAALLPPPGDARGRGELPGGQRAGGRRCCLRRFGVRLGRSAREAAPSPAWSPGAGRKVGGRRGAVQVGLPAGGTRRGSGGAARRGQGRRTPTHTVPLLGGAAPGAGRSARAAWGAELRSGRGEPCAGGAALRARPAAGAGELRPPRRVCWSLQPQGQRGKGLGFKQRVQRGEAGSGLQRASPLRRLLSRLRQQPCHSRFRCCKEVICGCLYPLSLAARPLEGPGGCRCLRGGTRGRVWCTVMSVKLGQDGQMPGCPSESSACRGGIVPAPRQWARMATRVCQKKLGYERNFVFTTRLLWLIEHFLEVFSLETCLKWGLWALTKKGVVREPTGDGVKPEYMCTLE